MTQVSGQTIGPWTLHETLGRGGNATVWNATHPDFEKPVALKLINTTKVEKESYQRFVREIGFLREHQAVSGVLPLLDAHLPDQPTKADPPWLAMPIAVPIATALDGKPLADVVAAMAAIADTLTRLQRDSNIAHRDIKPGNLYQLDGAWLIGDFGLVALPDADTLTAEGRQVGGPAHYTAYEMILNPTAADPHPADVYSLGKTLWVLATGQAWPPEGHQPVGQRGFGIGDFRPHPRANVLDQQVDVMTRLHPEERPSKEQVARDLATWSELSSEPVLFDVSNARSRIRTKLEKAISEQDIQEQRKDMTHAAIRRLQALTAPLNEGLKSLHPRTKVDSQSDEMTRNLLRTHYGKEVVIRWFRCTIVAPFDEWPGSTALRMGRSVELFGDGAIQLRLMVHVGPQGVMGTDFNWTLGEMSAPVGSVAAEKMLDDGIRELTDALKRGVEVLVEKLPDPQ